MFGVYNTQAMEGFNAILLGKRVDCYKGGVSYAELCSDEPPFKTPSQSACHANVGGHGDLRGACRNTVTRGNLDDEKQSAPPSPLQNAPLCGTRLPIFRKGNRYNAIWRVPKYVASESTLSGLEDMGYATFGKNNEATPLEDSNGNQKTNNGTLLQITPLGLRQFPSNDSITKARGELHKWRRHLLSRVAQKDCDLAQSLNITVTKLQSTPPSHVENACKPPLPRSGFVVSNTSAPAADRTTLPVNKPTRTRYFQSLTSSGAHFAICAHLPTRAHKKGRRPTLSVFTVYHIEVNAPSDDSVRRHVKDLFTVSKAIPPHHEASTFNLATEETPDVICDSGKFTIITAKKRNKRRCKFKNSFSGEKRNRDASANHVIKPGKGVSSAQSVKKSATRNKAREATPSRRPQPASDVEKVRLENNTRGEHSKFSPNCKTVDTALKDNSTLNTHSELNTNSTLNINSAINKTFRRVKDAPEISGYRAKKQSQVRASEKSRVSQNGTDQAVNVPTLKSEPVKGKADDGQVVSPVCHPKFEPNTKKRYQIGRVRTESRSTDPVSSCGREETKASITCPEGSNELIRTPRTSRSRSAANKCVTVVFEFDSDQEADDALDSTKTLNMAMGQCMRDSKRKGREDVIRKLLDYSTQAKKDKPRSPQDGRIVSLRKASQLSQMKDSNSGNEARIFPKVKLDGLRSRNRNTNHDDTWFLEQRQEGTDSMHNGTDWTGGKRGKDNNVDTVQCGGMEMDDDDMIETVSQCNDLFNSSQIFESDAEVTSQRKRSEVTEKREDDMDAPENEGRVCDRSEQRGNNESVSGKNIQQEESDVTRGEEGCTELTANLEMEIVHETLREECGTELTPNLLMAVFHTTPGIERSKSSKQWATPVNDTRSDDQSFRLPAHREFDSPILSGPTDFKKVKDDLVPHVDSSNGNKTVKESITNLGANVDTAILEKVSSDDVDRMGYRGSLFPNLGPREYLPRRGHSSLERLGNGHLETRITGNKGSASRRSTYDLAVTGGPKIHEANGEDDEHGCVEVEISKQHTNKGEPTGGTTLTAGPVDGCSRHVAVDAHNVEAPQAPHGADATSSAWMLLRKTVLPTVPERLPERRVLSRRRQALRFSPHNTSIGQRDRAGASGDCQDNPAKPRIFIKGKGMVLESPFSDDSNGKCKGVGETTLKPGAGKVADMPRADPGCDKSVRLPQLLGYGDTVESTRCDVQLQNAISAQTADSIKAAQKNLTYSTDFVYYGKAKVDTWLKAAYH
ncbi:unnamed protein product [Lymnaea stagnalis]|uniref:Uncharacterized protein n=1 Tax=Lymnaea stagnalis TaxID=6523 RepID=A0AAV2HA46_LYMST